MATAGRILIMPKGAWNAETTYENLDMVAHSGRAWLAKKASVGIEPSDANAEYWHDFLGMDVFTEENPPTAAQVGAVGLERLNSILTTSIKETALTLGYGLHVFQLGGASYTGNDLPDQMYTYSTAEVFVRMPGESVQIRVWGFGGKPTINCYYTSDEWRDWTTEFIPLSSKPSGSYEGNGSNTQRTINIGGSNDEAPLLLIYSPDHATHLLVSKAGAIGWHGNSNYTFTHEEIRFANSVLTIAHTDVSMNDNGKTYLWRVL